jgi:hypothetical protein
VFGWCGFLSFSLVFCLLGGWLGTTLYIHFIRRWVETRRRSSASRESEDEKKGGESTPFFAVGGFMGAVCRQGGPVQLTTSASRTYWTSPLWRSVYTASLTAARHQASVLGVGGATAPLTTSTAPTSAKRSSLRCVRSSVRRRSPTLLCLHRYSATASVSLSIKRRGVWFGWRRRRVSGLWWSVWVFVPVYISNA